MVFQKLLMHIVFLRKPTLVILLGAGGGLVLVCSGKSVYTGKKKFPDVSVLAYRVVFST